LTVTKLESATTIGLFDSGVGGLSVLRQLEGKLGSQRLIYVGDTARCPYGGRETAEISRFVLEIISWLLSRGADQIVMACNTSAALAAQAARSYFKIPIYDLIGSAALHAARLRTKVAVLATENTVRTRAFTNAIVQADPQAEVVEIGCPDLVPLVERGLVNEPETRHALRRYTRDFSAQGVGAVILGCTHYPFLVDALKSVLPPEISVIDPAKELLLLGSDCEGNGNGHGAKSSDRAVSCSTEIYVTGAPAAFMRAGEICLGRRLDTVYGITVDELSSALAANLSATPSPDWVPVSPAISPETVQLAG
jgi:glutamate racemase